MSGREQLRNQPSADVAGRTCDEDSHLLWDLVFKYGSAGLLRQDDRVDDVDDTVARLDVGLDDVRSIDADATFRGLDRDGLPIDRLRAPQLDDFHGTDGSGDDVVGEDRLEFGLVLRLEKALERACGELG